MPYKGPYTLRKEVTNKPYATGKEGWIKDKEEINRERENRLFCSDRGQLRCGREQNV